MSEWIDQDPTGLSDGELSEQLVGFQVLRARLDAAELVTIGEWDHRRAWADDGATTGPAWLRGHTGMAGSTAREKVRVARALRHMTVVAAAFAAGAIGYAKVRLLAGVRNEHTAEAFDRDEEMLVGFARRYSTDELAKILAYWKACAHPDGVSERAARQWDARGATMTDDPDGTGFLTSVLDPESAAVVNTELDAISDELWRADQRDPTSRRTRRQALADSLVEMARRSAATDPATATRARPEMVVMVDYDTIDPGGGGVAETADGVKLPGEAARRLACDAGIIRAVVAGRSEILDLGRSTPVPNAAQRRAVAMRFTGCIWPGCDRPANWCEVHHLDPYRRDQLHGGRTDLLNLAPACGHHHHQFHEGGYTAVHNPESDTITIHRPNGIPLATIEPNGAITRRPQTITPPAPAQPAEPAVA